MATNILGIGKSALTAAQVGLNTTGHNIANASTPGFSRQVMVQGAAEAQNFGFGFLGQGVQVATVRRIYSEHLATQVQSAQANQSGLASYHAQIRQINDMLADPAAGVSPALQGFFSSVQDLASAPASMPARQSVLSSAESLAGRIRGMDSRLTEIERGVNSQLVSSVSVVNAYAREIAALNDAISKAQGATGQPPNDLLDQRDQLVLDLNKEIKATVVKQGDGEYNVFVGNGQPLVVGTHTRPLVAVSSPTNPSRLEIGYRADNGSTVMIGDAGLAGGKIGGLVQFRNEALNPAQNALGRVAIGLAATFNAQHQAGFDLTGTAGGAFFAVGGPIVGASGHNTGSGVVSAILASAGALTTSDYLLNFDGTNYTVTRLSDNTVSTHASLPQTVDGVQISLASGTPAAGDAFLIRPTAQGAAGFAVAINDPSDIAAAGAAGAVGDNANALALAALQTSNTLAGGTATYLGAYGQMVSQVGNKTRELEVISTAATRLLDQSRFAMQSESGVNLDEEATNLLRYQQAYQAAAKVMQIAQDLFNTLLTIGR